MLLDCQCIEGDIDKRLVDYWLAGLEEQASKLDQPILPLSKIADEDID